MLCILIRNNLIFFSVRVYNNNINNNNAYINICSFNGVPDSPNNKCHNMSVALFCFLFMPNECNMTNTANLR